MLSVHCHYSVMLVAVLIYRLLKVVVIDDVFVIATWIKEVFRLMDE